MFPFGKLETDNQRKMVAKATLIAETIKGAKRFHSPIFLVFLKQEGGIVDVSLHDGITQHRTYQNMVNTLPTTFVTVGALSAMRALGLMGNVMEPVFLQEQDGWTIGIVVEVACDDNLRISGQEADSLNNTIHYHTTVGTRLFLATKTTGSMNDKDVQGVAIDHFALYIQDITCRAHTFQRSDIKTFITDRTKREGLIE